MRLLLVLALTCPIACYAEGIRLNYTWPTKDTDGNPVRVQAGEAQINGKAIAQLDPKLSTYDHNIPAGTCVRVSDVIAVTATSDKGLPSKPAETRLKRDRCTPTVPVVAPGQPPANFRIVNGVAQCTVHPTAVEVRLFILEPGGKLGSKLATWKSCGQPYAKWITGRTYVVKALYRDRQLSGRSNEFSAP